MHERGPSASILTALLMIGIAFGFLVVFSAGFAFLMNIVKSIKHFLG